MEPDSSGVSGERFWETLLDRYNNRLRAYALTTQCSEDEADEIAWDVWALAVEHESELRETEDCWPALITLLRLVCSERLRSWRREVELTWDACDVASLSTCASADSHVRWEAWRARALDALTPNERRALDYRYRWRWDFELVAAALDVSQVTARVHVSRGLARLRAYARHFPLPDDD